MASRRTRRSLVCHRLLASKTMQIVNEQDEHLRFGRMQYILVRKSRGLMNDVCIASVKGNNDDARASSQEMTKMKPSVAGQRCHDAAASRGTETKQAVEAINVRTCMYRSTPNPIISFRSTDSISTAPPTYPRSLVLATTTGRKSTINSHSYIKHRIDLL